MVPSPGQDFQLAGSIDEAGPAKTSFRARRFLSFLRYYWWIPSVTLVIGLALEAAYVYWKEPTFVSYASMWETVKLKLPEGGVFAEEMENYADTLNGLLKSETLRQQALAIIKSSTNNTSVPLNKEGEPLPVAIHVSGSAKSAVFAIQARSANPQYTRAYLNAIMAAYLDYKKNVRQEVSGDTLASISEQMQRWERDLNAEQNALLAFERTNNLALLREEATITGSYLAKLKTELSDLQLEARLLNATNNSPDPGTTGTVASPSDINPALPASAVPEHQSAAKELELLKMEREKLSKYLRPEHPKIVKLDAEIERAERLQKIYERQNLDQLAAARQANQLKIETQIASIKEWEVKAEKANAIIAEAERLKVNIQRIQSVYDRLVLLVQNVGISRKIDQENLAILETATPPKRSYTSEKSGLALAILGGVAVGLGIVFGIGYRDDRFTSVTEVSSALGDTVVGMLPEASQEANGLVPLLEFNDPRHIYAESYRSLRSALLFVPTEGERPKVLLITSAMPSEGKSTVAINLTRTLALSGSRVLLVDCDLRKGHLHHLLGLQREPGLVEVLNHSCELQQAMQKDSQTNVTFIASGGKFSGNPGDLFLESGLDQFLARWRREFDYVVIDSSPLFAADDASCLAPRVDGTLFVVRNRHSSARAAREALEMLAQRQARLLGVVFNGADTSGRSYYHYKYADYHPSSQSARGEENSRNEKVF
jgi:polysaccharide biosynthesis transport protein